MSTLEIAIGLAVLVLGPGGAAWVAVRIGLNGARDDIREIKASAQRVESKVGTTSEGVARLEQRADDHERRIQRLEDAA